MREQPPKFFDLSRASQKPRAVPAEPKDISRSARSLALCSQREARAHLSHEMACKLHALPLAVMDMLGRPTLTVAVALGKKLETDAALRFAVDIAVRSAEVPASALDEAIFFAYCGDERRLLRESESLAQLTPSAPPVREEPPPFRPPTGEVGAFLASLIEYGISRGASDIHVMPRPQGTFVSMRINGELVQRDEALCSTALHRQLITRLKVLAGLDTAQRQLPLDGSFSVPIAGRSARVRLSTVPTIHGEKAVLRLLAANGCMPLQALGFAPEIFEAITRAIENAHGMVVVAGPTGSGKSSTLYALAEHCARHGKSVSSVEDPVEQCVPAIAQSQVDDARGLTFPICLRSIVRQDPDAIMVGEMRDAESVSIALQAALTGHLLLTSVHAPHIAGIVQRLRSLHAEQALIAECALLFINQRLLPKLCERCKVIDLAASRTRDRSLFRSVGCAHCDYSGFAGRIPIAELLTLDSTAREELRSENARWAERHLTWRNQVQKLLDNGEITAEAAAPYIGLSQRSG